MTNEKVKELLKNILGRSVYNNSMTVPKDITKLVKSVDYLTIQLIITKRWCDEDGKNYIMNTEYI